MIDSGMPAILTPSCNNSPMGAALSDPATTLREGEALVRHLATATRERVLDTSESQHSSCIAPMLAQQTIWRSPTS